MLKFLFFIASLVFLLLVVAAVVLVRPDLNRKELNGYISPASSFMTMRDGSEVHYRDEGDPNGPVVVLIHGGFGSLHNWEPWMPDLSRHFRVVSMDLPGHGLTGWVNSGLFHRESNVAVVAELVDTLELGDFTLVGHSMGGAVALVYTLDFPDRVNSLILIGSEGVPPEGGYQPDGLGADEEMLARKENLEDISLSWVDRLLARVGSPWVVEQGVRSMLWDQSLVTPGFVDRFGRILRHTRNREAFVLMYRQTIASIDLQVDLLPRLAEIEVPALLLFAAEDQLAPVSVGKRFDKALKESRLVIYENTGHLIMHEVPVQSVREATTFIRSRHGSTQTEAEQRINQ